MASESLYSSKSSVGIDEFEELEVTEFDGALLRELLEEPGQAEAEDDSIGCIVQPVEKGFEPNANMDSFESSEKVEFHVQDLWLDMMEMDASLASEESIGWYAGGCMGEIVEMVDLGGSGDYSQFYNGDYLDEIGYGGLWQGN